MIKEDNIDRLYSQYIKASNKNQPYEIDDLIKELYIRIKKIVKYKYGQSFQNADLEIIENMAACEVYNAIVKKKYDKIEPLINTIITRQIKYITLDSDKKDKNGVEVLSTDYLYGDDNKTLLDYYGEYDSYNDTRDEIMDIVNGLLNNKIISKDVVRKFNLYLEGYTYQEIGDMYNVSKQRIHNQIHSLKLMIRDIDCKNKM